MWNKPEPAAADPYEIEAAVLRGVAGRGAFSPQFLACVPVRLGCMTDCFGPQERKRGVTLATLRTLNALRYPYLILTKSALIGESPYLDEIDPDLAYVQFSIPTENAAVAALLEPGAPPPAERFAAARALAKRGVYTAIRVNPLLPWFPDEHFTKAPKRVPELAWWSTDLVGMAADAGMQTLIAGFLRLDRFALRRCEAATGVQLRRLFAAGVPFRNTALHYRAPEKRWYYEMLKALCDERGMAFSVCYDGDDAYTTFRDLWADPEDCCNGRRNVRGFGARTEGLLAAPTLKPNEARSDAVTIPAKGAV
jgi:DNA repair photolyase